MKKNDLFIWKSLFQWKSTMKFLIFLWCSVVLNSSAQAQVCQGSFGDPVVNIDFGRGQTLFGPSLGQNTNYRFTQISEVQDGTYAIIKAIQGGWGGSWYPAKNHTPNDPDGYMMIVGANAEPGVFYETEVNQDLCPNTTYEFAAWVMNLMKFEGIRPNLTFYVLKPDGEVLQRYDTGDIVESSEPTWKQYGFLFSTSGVSRVKIRIVNNGKGGYGNDLALDDITFRACGPQMTAAIDNESKNATTICEGNGARLSVQVAGSSTLQYLWQKKEGTEWKDLPGENTTNLTLPAAALPAGDNLYRMVAAESTNFNSPACRTASEAITIHVIPLPKIEVVNPLVVCIGDPVKLEVTGTEGAYLWTGPNGFSSTERSPVINNADFQLSGDYTIKVSTGDCSTSAILRVNVVPPPVAAVEATEVSVCEGSSVTLNASGGTVYRWTPETGLSDPTIANPVASPLITTVYTVSVSNGGCAGTAQVAVTVFKKITADAGKSRSIIEGQSIQLNGQITGDKVKYFWTPSDDLDDPAKLNPVATPLKDITYTLNAWSEAGCAGSTASVLVKVYPKLEIPNTFSPNGDNINDLWNIPALEAYPQASINIYNRYGEKVFSSANGLKQWNGKHKGKDVPAGAYFYVLNLKNGQKSVSGSIMVLR